jgi:uncharacterized protein (UPF0261 family)
MARVVVIVATLDTKAEEARFIADQLASRGASPLIMDVGIQGSARTAADISREEVAVSGGTSLDEVRRLPDRGTAIAAVASGARRILEAMVAEHRLAGIIAVGGSGGTFIAAEAMRELPFGLPKVIVSTVASANVRPYIGASDIVMMPSVVDMTGLNRPLAIILRSAAVAVAAMADAYAVARPPSDGQAIAATMFGVTTPAVSRASDQLKADGREVIVFHANGTGGQAMEALIKQGYFAAALDITTTELADELAGGICSAGSERLRVAAAEGLPQVVSVGALDMVNFGPPETVPERYRGRLFYRHAAAVTLMRTSPGETRRIGQIIGERLGTPRSPTTVVFPTMGLSRLSVPGGPFFDPKADTELLAGIRESLNPAVNLVVADTHINDPSLVDEMVRMLRTNLKGSS